MFRTYKKIAMTPDLTSLEKLKSITEDIIRTSYAKKEFLSSLADFLFQMRKDGRDFTGQIKKRTIRLQYLFFQLLNKGVKDQELQDQPIQETLVQIFAMIESFAFQMALIDDYRPESSIRVLNLYLESLEVTGTE